MPLLVAAIVVLFAGGLAALAAGRFARVANVLGAGSAVAGCALAAWPVVRVIAGGEGLSRRVLWSTPAISVALGIDALSAFFMVPVLVLGALGAVQATAIFARAGRSPAPAWFGWNTLVAGMLVVAAARDAVLFLVAWEMMSLAAWVLVVSDHERKDVRRAGWIYLVSAHLGTAALVALFLLLIRAGGASLESLPQAAGPLAAALFALALAGFGVKAGFVPLHVWLPGTYAAAPPHVAALMSGAMAKLGLYGLLRVACLLGAPQPWWGPVLVAVGACSALTGIALALVQRDLRRSLGYSSVENTGLIALALGLGFLGWSSGNPALASLGFLAGLFHVWSHAAMKGLMFLASGAVSCATGLQDLERMGGLLKRMPVSGAVLFLGAVAMSGLPPLNGFVTECLLVIGLVGDALRSGSVFPLLAVGGVAFVGSLAAACFLRIVGVALLGSGRSEEARGATEAPWAVVAPGVVLAAACVAMAVVPSLPAAAAARAMAVVSPGTSAAGAVRPLPALGLANAVLLGSLLAGAGLLALGLRGRRSAAGSTWGCGYLSPSPRMQYTGRSFSEILATRLLPAFLRPGLRGSRPEGMLPGKADFGSEYDDPLKKRGFEPFFARWADRFARLRWLQQGQLNIYIIYILVVLVLGLGWATWSTLRVKG